ncbi:hypothetical protein DCS_03355 [Drechmeria coniospora]|uniref:Uncharacterized protein n=1 Tax=Drechmeria coniospora TaxID=98403 RepID=A0A151GGY9_DRECN|nr:hypothetical protein DCS_03355 [Drechmeria coniospora]KYK56355.1 hypothetical protein DCS_03355 [Drechmeria coniospora]
MQAPPLDTMRVPVPVMAGVTVREKYLTAQPLLAHGGKPRSTDGPPDVLLPAVIARRPFDPRLPAGSTCDPRRRGGTLAAGRHPRRAARPAPFCGGGDGDDDDDGNDDDDGGGLSRSRASWARERGTRSGVHPSPPPASPPPPAVHLGRPIERVDRPPLLFISPARSSESTDAPRLASVGRLLGLAPADDVLELRPRPAALHRLDLFAHVGRPLKGVGHADQRLLAPRRAGKGEAKRHVRPLHVELGEFVNLDGEALRRGAQRHRDDGRAEDAGDLEGIVGVEDEGVELVLGQRAQQAEVAGDAGQVSGEHVDGRVGLVQAVAQDDVPVARVVLGPALRRRVAGKGEQLLEGRDVVRVPHETRQVLGQVGAEIGEHHHLVVVDVLVALEDVDGVEGQVVDDLGALVAHHLQRRGKGLELVGAVDEARVARHADALPPEARPDAGAGVVAQGLGQDGGRGLVPGVDAGDGGEEVSRVLDGPRHGTDGVAPVRDGDDHVARGEADGRLDADDVVAARRRHDRAVRVGPEGGPGEADGDGDGAARRRAVGVVLLVVGADGLAAGGRPAVGRVEAAHVGPLRHVGLAEDDGAGAAQLGDDGAVARHRRADERVRAGRRVHGVGRGDVVLDEDGHAVEGGAAGRAGAVAVAPVLVEAARDVDGVGVDLDDGAQLVVDLSDARQVGLDEVDARKGAVAEASLQLVQRRVQQRGKGGRGGQGMQGGMQGTGDEERPAEAGGRRHGDGTHESAP